MPERRECKALSGANPPKPIVQPPAPRADAAIRNFFVAVGKLGKDAAQKPVTRAPRKDGKA